MHFQDFANVYRVGFECGIRARGCDKHFLIEACKFGYQNCKMGVRQAISFLDEFLLIFIGREECTTCTGSCDQQKKWLLNTMNLSSGL